MNKKNYYNYSTSVLGDPARKTGGICELNLKEYDKAIYYFDVVLLNPYYAFYTKAEWQKSVTLIAKGDKATAQILLNKIISDGKEYKDSAKQKLLQLK